VERLFEHHGHHDKQDEENKAKPESQPKAPHEESEKEKYMNWYHKEEQEEADGETYGGLM
jgi:hypothetical protein